MSILLVLFFSQDIGASIILPISIDEQLDQADIVIDGTVVSKKSRKVESESRIVTDISLGVNRESQVSIRNANNLVNLVVPGGVFWGEEHRIEGVPILNIGDRAMFLLKQSSHGKKYYLSNLGLSVYFIKDGKLQNYLYPDEYHLTYSSIFARTNIASLISHTSPSSLNSRQVRELSSIAITGQTEEKKVDISLIILIVLMFLFLIMHTFIVRKE